jgi:hypothetical protein
MNKIVIGIMCFGEEYYFNHVKSKLNQFRDRKITCLILTDKPNEFVGYSNVYTILYTRKLKSYHDKMLLIKKILDWNDICVLMDADLLIKDYSIIDTLLNYQFKKGITYIDTLKNHRCNFEYIKDIQMNSENIDWYNYKKYVEKIYPNYNDLETIYEYFMIFNKDGFNDDFYSTYEKLQVLKEACELMSKERIIHGGAEGVSIHISAKITNTQIQRDEELFLLIKDKAQNINKL